MPPNLQSNNPKKRKLFDSLGSKDAPKLPLSPLQQSSYKEVADLIRLQKCNAEEISQITRAVEDVKQVLIGIKEAKFVSIRDADNKFHSRGVHIPYPECGDCIRNLGVCLSPPDRVEVEWGVGHKMLRKSEHGDISVDLIIQVPSATFHPKDYLEYRYHRKRVIYLSYLLLALKTAQRTSGYSFLSDFLDGDELRPIILIDCFSSRCKIRLIPAISLDLFPLDKLLPDTCRADRQSGVPTPMYNSSIIADAYHLVALDIIQQYTASNEGFKESLILGRVWLSRLGFSSHLLDGGFGEKEWAMLQCHLAETTTTSQTASRYSASSDAFQMFKSVLNLIATRKIHPELNIPVLHREQTDYNIFSKMSRWSSLALVKHSLAVISLDKLGISPRAQLQRVFENPLYNIADITMSLPIDLIQFREILPETAKRWNLKHYINEYCYDLFSKGLTDRFRMITFSTPKPHPRQLEDASDRELQYHDTYVLTIFITLDEKRCTRVLDYGPEVQDAAKTVDFREFWEDKAELRRFKDGRVMETVRWDPSLPPTEQILSFLHRKLTASFPTTQPPIFQGLESDIYLTSPPLVWPAGDSYETAASEFQMVANTIRQIKDFPLGFKKISGVSPSLSSTSVKPPFPCSRHLGPPLEGELELEGSSMWPIDPEQRSRSEFGLLLKLRAELEATKNFLTVRVGIATTNRLHNICFLDILTKRQYLFRFRLMHALENPQRGVSLNLPPDPSLGILSQGPIHPNNTLQLRASTIQRCSQHQYFSSSVRVLKKWFQSHHLAFFFTEDILELFTTVAFSQYTPASIPGSTYCSFRRVMARISHWDWRRTPLEVEVLRHFADDERACILKEFGAYQHTNQNSEACLSIVLPSEGGKVDWIRYPIPLLVATRMTQLARETHNRLLSPSTPFQAVFEPDMSFFDFVIILKRKFNPHEPVECYSNVSAVPKKYGPLLLCREFIGELKVQTEEYILLFPSEDSLTIGGLWKTRKELVVSHLQDSASLTIKCGTLNKTAVLGLIMELGLGLVERIHIKISD
ncbi:hypothetical protein TWF225_010282 [Orbilia oligospora]|nr:hypothetical protein TWF751_011436 [Orbilia oligospora]KAF3172524.1 hypothetical protein TWF225_010282 [Orbilia oligospora]KAF3236292.1 hypothetical protein TWF128_001441 [Orbilia oligospora]KAF3241633.1 hypothetical protein TWF217_011963 [Orbilia oligospora]KAF3291967.1 hypothetical protein TWF132_006226 [Orbilia oligospora]